MSYQILRCNNSPVPRLKDFVVNKNNYTKVADVDVGSLEKLCDMVVGDLAIDGNGVAHFCVPVGWVEVTLE